MNVLVIDTALSSLRLALLGEGLAIARCHDMARGQAEALFPAIESLMDETGVSLRQISAIAVNIGPGSFTGTRVGVAAAKGLALGCGLPLFGITTLEALGFEVRGTPAAAIMDARRGEVYVQLFEAEGRGSAPFAVSIDDVERLDLSDRVLIGSGASLIPGHRVDMVRPVVFADPLSIARLAASGVGRGRTAPFYLRGADAKPQLDKVLKRQAESGGHG